MVLVDRGRRIGGRMASRRIDDRAVDLGASYLTVSDPVFGAVVDDWQRRGLARPWTDTFAVAGGEPKSGPLRWAAPGGLRSLVEDLASGLEVVDATTVREVRRRADGWSVDDRPASAVVLAMPDPQAHRLLGEDLRAELPAAASFEPVLALVATWSQRCWDFDGLFVNDHPSLAWVADDGRRRGDGAPGAGGPLHPVVRRRPPGRPGRRRAGARPGPAGGPGAPAADQHPRPPLDVRPPRRADAPSRTR